MGMIYADPFVAINKTHFFIQQSGATPYQPNLPKYFTRFNVRPFHEESLGWENAVATPAIIVDLFHHKKEFFFENNEDKKQVVQILNEYIEKVYSLGKPTREEENYIKRCRVAISHLSESYNANMNHLAQRFPHLYGVMDFLSVLTDKFKARWNI